MYRVHSETKQPSSRTTVQPKEQQKQIPNDKKDPQRTTTNPPVTKTETTEVYMTTDRQNIEMGASEIQTCTCFPEFSVSEHWHDDQQVAQDVHDDGGDKHAGQ